MSEKKSDKPIEEQDLDETGVAEMVWERFNRAMDSHEDWVDEAKMFDDFFAGDQWSEEDLAKLAETGRPALTINLIKPAILAIVGEQQKNRADIDFKPRNSRADLPTANLLRQAAQYIDNDVDYNTLESEIFLDGAVTDRGYLDVRMSFDNCTTGDIVMTSDNPRQIVLDPDTRTYDPDQWPGVFETYWASLDELEKRFGKEKTDSLRLGTALNVDWIDQSLSLRWKDDRIAREGSYEAPDVVMPDGSERYIESVRVVEHQAFVYRDAWVFVDPITGDITDPRCDLPIEELRPLAVQRGLVLIKMRRRRVRWVVVAHNVVLHIGWSPYPFLTKIPYFPTFRRGRPTGVVRDLISPQEQLNKVESQELHVINTTANSGWIYEDGSILNMEDDEIAQRGAETGLIFKVRKGAGFSPQKILPNQIPSGLSNKATKNVDYLRFISMVNDAMLGFSSPEVSGVALNAKKESGITAFIPSFNNLTRTRKIVAKRWLWMVQNFWTLPRLIRVTDYSKPDRPDVEVAINMPDETGAVLNNVTVGRYDIIVTSVPARDTAEEGQFAQMIEMRNAGIAVPDDEVVRRSNLMDKFPLAERIAQMQGMGEPSPEQVQIQAMLQQMQVMEMQLNLGKLEAEVANLQAQAQLNIAKAEQLRTEAQMAGEGGPNEALLKVAVERERIAADLQKSREQIMAKMAEVQQTLDTKVRIAQLQVGAKQDAMLHKSALDRAREASKEADIARKERVESVNLALKAAMQAKQIDATKEVAKAKASVKPASKNSPKAKKK